MANKEIKQTIRLAGEKEYSAAIKDAQRNLRTLKSELKAETAELGANATAQQKNEARARSLKAQIAEQEKVVETLKKALAEAKKDYGDNEDVVQKWEQKLNEARATLGNMQSGLADAENAMRGASDATAEGVTATKSFADALGEVASVGESVSGAIESIFTGLISTVRDVVVDLWDMIGETAAKANNWTDIAGYWNTDPANVEKWARAIEASGNSFADFETVVTRLALGGKGKEIAEMLGISDANYADQWDYAVAAMERIHALRSEGNLPDSFWETVFGEKKATKAMDIINDWEAVQEGLKTFNADESGYSMGEDALQTMNDLYVQMKTIEQKLVALKDQFAAGLGTITADLLVNVSGSLDALNEFMNADTDAEREAALEKLRQNIEAFFGKVAEAIRAGLEAVNEVGKSLSESDDPIVSAIGNLMVSITEALQWIVDNKNKVKIALEVIFGVWLTAKLGMIAAQMASIVAQIKVITDFKDWSVPEKAAEGASGSGGNGAAAAGGGGTAAAKAGWFTNLGYSFELAGGLSTALPVAALAAVGYGGAKLIQANLRDELLNAVYGGDNGEGGVVDAMSEESLRLAREYFKIYSDESKTGTEEAFDARDRLFESLERDGFDLSEQAVGLLENTFDNLLNGVDPDGLIDRIEARAPDFFDQGGYWADAAAAINDHIDRLMGGSESNAHSGLTSEDVGAFKGLPGLMRQALLSRIDGLKVYMDGEVVGRIVTPYVSGAIARDVTQ